MAVGYVGLWEKGTILLYWHYTTHRESADPIAAAGSRAHVIAIEVQEVGVVAAVGSRRPIDAVAATKARWRTEPFAGIYEVIWERTPDIGTLRRCIVAHSYV